MVNNMQEYDIIIIGAGPGGYETALYAKEKGLSGPEMMKAVSGGAFRYPRAKMADKKMTTIPRM